MDKLIELPTKDLLDKFGLGSHKPGSGSAAALQALLAVQLIRTVIKLSKERDNYRKYLSNFNRIEEDLDNRIYPELLNFFQLDSEQFDKVIKLRKERYDEKNDIKKKKIIENLDDALLQATKTPIAIAKLSVDLAEHALFIFDNGFKSARGDSGVALNNAMSTVSGCLSIINLNLLTLGDDKQVDVIRLESVQLRDSFQEMIIKTTERLDVLEKEVQRNQTYNEDLKSLLLENGERSDLSYDEIEKLVRRVQNFLWRYSDKIFKKTPPENMIDLLNPEIVLTKILGYQFKKSRNLGNHGTEGGTFEIAGIIDKSQKQVTISQHFPKESQNFTAAHELGHVFLHRQTVLHRDRAIDGASMGISREPIELQADKFATFFLLPKKRVKLIFRDLFLSDKFIINEDTVFALTGDRVSTFRRKYRNLRELSRFIAGAGSYDGNQFNSMSKIFNVSVETMAIRLEELELVEFPSIE